MNANEMTNNREPEAKAKIGGPIPPAEATVLVDMVEYQAGAAVSRPIVSRKTGTVTLFAFDEGQGLREHTAPFDALLYALEGKGEIMIDGRPFELSSGETILLPANHPHAVQAISRFKMLLTIIRS